MVSKLKTLLTKEIEKALYYYCIELGGFVVEEVALPGELGIVDTLACFSRQGEREWRCYELKISKSDFYSAAKLSFVGHYNYFVLTAELYEKVKAAIPSEIGVLIYRPYKELEETLPAEGTFMIAKRPKRQELQLTEAELLERFNASLFREVRKAKQMAYGPSFFSTEQLYKELKRRSEAKDGLSPDNYYERFLSEITNQRIESLEEELEALKQDYAFLKSRAGNKRRPTEPLE